MTRETKIGLLVGLAFIIVIGILLSDHLTASTEAPPATLAQTGSNVRQAITTPGGTQPPITRVTAPQIEPQHQVLTPRELAPATPPTSIVQVGGPSIATNADPAPVNPPVQSTVDIAPPVSFVRNEEPAPVEVAPPSATTTPPAYNDNPQNVIARIAQQYNEPMVTYTPSGGGQPIQIAANTTTPTQAPAGSGGYREYTVQPGDSLSRIASKFLGSNTKANRDAIVRLNPSLQQNPDKIIVGKTYRIPASAGAAPQRGGPQPVAPQQTAPAIAAAREVPAAATEYWYTVKQGDSLWKIANEQLGNGGAGVAAIKELNKDALNGSDTVTPSMKLKLPGRPVAQAN